MMYSVRGNIQDEIGTPVSHATVMVVEGSKPFPDIAAITNENGAFSLSLETGTYKVLVVRDGSSQVFPLQVNETEKGIQANWVFKAQ